jgi:hypothetical protein
MLSISFESEILLIAVSISYTFVKIFSLEIQFITGIEINLIKNILLKNI